jgi:hypothetical protein
LFLRVKLHILVPLHPLRKAFSVFLCSIDDEKEPYMKIGQYHLITPDILETYHAAVEENCLIGVTLSQANSQTYKTGAYEWFHTKILARR